MRVSKYRACLEWVVYGALLVTERPPANIHFSKSNPTETAIYYGGSGLNKGDPTCVNFFTGEIAWKSQPPAGGSAAVLYADGNLIFRYDRGLVVLVEATPKGFNIKGRFTPITADGPAWAHPVIFDKKLFLRHNDLLLCYDVGAPVGK